MDPPRNGGSGVRSQASQRGEDPVGYADPTFCRPRFDMFSIAGPSPRAAVLTSQSRLPPCRSVPPSVTVLGYVAPRRHHPPPPASRARSDINRAVHDLRRRVLQADDRAVLQQPGPADHGLHARVLLRRQGVVEAAV